jgi:hypothetical protein
MARRPHAKPAPLGFHHVHQHLAAEGYTYGGEYPKDGRPAAIFRKEGSPAVEVFQDMSPEDAKKTLRERGADDARIRSLEAGETVARGEGDDDEDEPGEEDSSERDEEPAQRPRRAETVGRARAASVPSASKTSARPAHARAPAKTASRPAPPKRATPKKAAAKTKGRGRR